MNATTWRAVFLAVLATGGFFSDRAAAQFTETNIAYAKRDLDSNFYPDDTTTLYRIRGRVTSPNFSTNATEFYIQDTNDNIGILVSATSFTVDTNSFQLGQEAQVTDVIRQTNGVRCINPQIAGRVVQTDATIVDVPPVVLTITNLLAAAESNESRFVRLNNVRLSSGSWPAWKSSATLVITGATGVVNLRIDADTDVDGQLAPTNAFDVQGIFTQFDTSTNANGGYQLLVRFYTDVMQNTGQEPPSLFIENSNALYSVAAGAEFALNLLGLDRNATDTLTIATGAAPGTSSVTPYGNRAARFSWTPDAGDVGTTNTIVFTVTDGITTGEASVAVYVLSDEQANIILNEVQWDPDTVLGDANGDGVANIDQDEFVEIVNNNTGEVDISGWVLRVGTNELFTFPPTILTGKTAVVVFGGGSPTGLFGNATVYAPTSTWFGLVNSGNNGPINLLNTGGTQIFSLDYGPFDDNVNQSFTRNPDLTGDFVPHLTANPLKRYSPGTFNSGAAFPGSGLTNTAPILAAIPNTFARIGQVRTVSLSAADVEGNGITLSASNAPPTAVVVDNLDGTGVFTYTGVVADAGSNFTVEIYASDGSASSSRSFVLSVVPQQYSGLLINEYLADPDAADGSYVDANNDGVTNATQDEFVELVNASTNPINMAGFMIFDGVGLRHTFSSATVPTGGAIVVFGGGSILNFSNPPAQTASTGTLGLNNSATPSSPESIILYSPSTQIVDRVDYTNTQPAAASETRYPDITGDFSNHFEVSLGLLRASPGRRADGSAFLTNQPPILQPIGNKAVTVSNTLQFAVVALEIDGDAVTLVASNLPGGAQFGATNGVGLFTWTSASPVSTNFVTFHAFDKDGFDSATISITVNPVPGGGGINTNCGLIISEYVEGTGNNKALELYNGSGVSIDLAAGQYVIMGYNNGASVATATYTWALSGTIAPAGTFVVGSSAAGSTLLALMQQSFGGANWNGDDAIVLRSGGTNGPVVDSMGQIGVDPGTTWTNSTGTIDAVDNTLRRKSVVGGGDTNAFDAYYLDEWDSFPVDTFDGVGSHSNACTTSAINGDDIDHDGMPDEWEALYFTGPTNADAYTDSDLDGFFNIEEFVAQTDPTDDGSYFRVEAITTGVDRAISVDSVTGRIYTLRVLTNLVTDAPGALQPGSVTGTGTRVSLTDTRTNSARSYRVGVQMQ